MPVTLFLRFVQLAVAAILLVFYTFCLGPGCLIQALDTLAGTFNRGHERDEIGARSHRQSGASGRDEQRREAENRPSTESARRPYR